jgi:hypothetical protein
VTVEEVSCAPGHFPGRPDEVAANRRYGTPDHSRSVRLTSVVSVVSVKRPSDGDYRRPTTEHDRSLLVQRFQAFRATPEVPGVVVRAYGCPNPTPATSAGRSRIPAPAAEFRACFSAVRSAANCHWKLANAAVCQTSREVRRNGLGRIVSSCGGRACRWLTWSQAKRSPGGVPSQACAIDVDQISGPCRASVMRWLEFASPLSMQLALIARQRACPAGPCTGTRRTA